MGESYFAAVPTALYGAVPRFAALAHYMLAHAFIALHGKTPALAQSMGSDLRNKLFVALYIVAIPLAFLNPWIADALYVAAAVIWFIPDRCIERSMDRQDHA